MGVRTATSLSELLQNLQRADQTHLFVLDFYADWCGPCRMIAPFFSQLANNYPNASFFKIDVDHQRDIMTRYNVRAMPTFVFIKGGQEVHRIQGANQGELQHTINRWYSNPVPPENPYSATPRERAFLERFVSYTQITNLYADPIYQTLARSVIPEERLIAEATLPVAGTAEKQLNKFALAQALLAWFKGEFFSWCDTPNCSDCGQMGARPARKSQPTTEERSSQAHDVEIYDCQNCKKDIRFARYNDPAKLLETRTGRCGEWANCFTLIAAAMGFDARLILDTTDHVWTELWIDEQKRWVHCDPCENLIDKPLVYEKGWNKKLSYVIAYGYDHVCDVTWRYVVSSRQAVRRRVETRPETFALFLSKLGARQQANTSNQRKKEIIQRRVCELIEMLSAEGHKKKADTKSYGGRTTGDVEWRTARGEIGTSQTKTSIQPGGPIQLNTNELESKTFRLQYSSAKDEYERGGDVVKGFEKMASGVRNVQRKVDLDWKKAYLCRDDGSDSGEITWTIDLNNVVEVKSAKLKFDGNSQFESGRVFVAICIGETCMKVPKSGVLELENLASGTLKITANMMGGEGDNAFQHAQLFRCDSNAVDDVQFIVELTFS